MKRKTPIFILIVMMILTSCGKQNNETTVKESVVEETPIVESTEKQTTTEIVEETTTESETAEDNYELCKTQTYEIWEDTYLEYDLYADFDSDKIKEVLICSAPNEYVGAYSYICLQEMQSVNHGDGWYTYISVIFDNVMLSDELNINTNTLETYTDDDIMDMAKKGIVNGQFTSSDMQEFSDKIIETYKDFYGTIREEAKTLNN